MIDLHPSYDSGYIWLSLLQHDTLTYSDMYCTPPLIKDDKAKYAAIYMEKNMRLAATKDFLGTRA